MYFTRSTATIALVAYLLGGWLAPAVHDHAAHSESATCEHAVSCCHVSSDAAACTAGSAENDASLNPHWPAADCDGLCVLCHISARKFTTTAAGDAPSVRAGPTQRLTLVDHPLCRSLRLRIDGPRGPPARLA